MAAAVSTTTYVTETGPRQKGASASSSVLKVFPSSSTVAGLPLFLQPKLAISQPGDPHEQEAERVAEQILRMPGPTVQRKCAACVAGGRPCPACEKEEPVKVSRKAQGATAGDAPPSVSAVIRSLGSRWILLRGLSLNHVSGESSAMSVCIRIRRPSSRRRM